MRFLDKKGISLAPETLVKLMLLVAFLVIVLGLIFLVQGGLSGDSSKKYSCWLSSSARSSGSFLSSFFPDLCTVRVVKDTLDMRGVSMLLRDTWWQFGAGKVNYALTHGDVFEAAQFKVSGEVGVESLMEYLLTHRKGKVSSMEASDYNYLQEGAKGSTVCFDFDFKSDGNKFKPDQQYFLFFADSSSWDLFKTDKLIVMKELKPRSYWGNENSFFCYAPLTKVITTGEILNEANLLGGGWVV